MDMPPTYNFEQARQYAFRRLQAELNPALLYHCLRHTAEDIVPAATAFAQGEGVRGEDLDLLLTAAWFHDLGFIETRAGHEAVGARIAIEVLPGFGYGEAQIMIIQGIIMATVIPQSPNNLLEQIMADADLDVLGRDDFAELNNNLRRELSNFGQEFTDLQWFGGQHKFVSSHVYFTATARALRNAGQEKSVAYLSMKLEEARQQSPDGDGGRPAALQAQEMGRSGDGAAIINTLAAALSRAETQSRRLNSLNRVAQAVSSTRNLNAILEIAAREIVAQLEARSCGVTLMNEARTYLEMVAFAGVEGETGHAGLAIPLASNPGTQHVIATRQSLVIADAQNSPLQDEAARQRFRERGTTCMLITPLIVRDEVIGTFGTHTNISERVFTTEEVELAVTIAGQISGAIENARLYAETQKRYKETEILRAANVALTQSLDLDAVLATLLDYLQQIVPYDSGSVFLLEDDAYLIARAARGYETWVENPEKAINVRFDFRNIQHIHTVIEDQVTVVIPDVTQHPHWVVAETSRHVRNWLAVPLVVGGKTIGMYSLDKVEPGYFTAEHQRLAENLAAQAAIAFQNAALFLRQQVAREQAETLRSAALALGSTLSLQDVFELILTELRRVVPYDSCSVQQLDGDAMVIVGGHGFPNLDELLGARFDWRRPNDPGGEVVRLRKPVIIANVLERFEHFKDETHGRGRVHGWMGVPLLFGERMTGMLTLDKIEEDFYTPDHADLAQAFAIQAATAIENARLFDETQLLLQETRQARETEATSRARAEMQSRRLDTLNRVAKAVSSTRNLNEILEIAAREIVAQLSVSSCGVTLMNPAGTHLEVVAFAGMPGQASTTGIVIPLEGNPGTQKVIATRQPLVIADAQNSPLQNEAARAVFRELGITCLMITPIIVRDEVIGTFGTDTIEVGRVFTVEEMELVGTIAGQISGAIENARLFDETRRLLKLAEARAQELSIINSVQEALASNLFTQSVYDLIGDKIRDIFDAQVVDIGLYDRDEELLHFPYTIERGVRYPDEPMPLVGYRKHAMTTRQPLSIPQDSAEIARQYGNPIVLLGEEPKSVLFVPLVVGDEAIGVISLQNLDREFAFSDSDISLLNTLANAMSVALEKARLFEETQRLLKITEARAAELSAISKVSQALIVESELEKTIELIGNQMLEIFPADIVYVALLDPQTNLIHFPFQVGEDFTTLKLGEGITSRIIQSGEPLLMNEGVNERTQEMGVANIGRQVLSYLGVPIKTSQGTIGVISVQSTTREGVFDDNSLHLLATIAANAGAALHNARLFSDALENLRQVEILTTAARAIEDSLYEPAMIASVADRGDALGELARVFAKMADEVRLREQRLKRQLAQLQMDIEEKKLARAETVSLYLPMDRRQAMASGKALPEAVSGTALFADLSGFTALTESLAKELGLQRGAEEMIRHLNRVMTNLIDEVHHYGGSVIGFSGDAITCWFDDLQLDGRPRNGSSVERAAACALAMQNSMVRFAAVATPNGKMIALSIKVALACGPALRLMVGEGTSHQMDVIAGDTLAALADAEHLAENGEIVMAVAGVPFLDERFEVAVMRQENRFAVLSGLARDVEPEPWPTLPPDAISEADIQPWMHPVVFEKVRLRQSDMLSELRPATALFMKFGGLDYNDDPAAGAKLDGFIQWVEGVIAPHHGSIIQFTFGDKGSYIYIVFGAPVAYADDIVQAVFTALELAAPPESMAYMTDLSMGLASGLMRVGAYGGAAHRTYGAIGDRTNLAARLMIAASESAAQIPEGQRAVIFCAESVYEAARDRVAFEAMPSIHVKGKTERIAIFRPLRRLVDFNPEAGITLERAQRIDRLSPSRQLALKVASVIGVEFSLNDLSAIYPEEHTCDELLDHLQALAEVGLIQRSAAEAYTYRFEDAMTHEEAYNLMLFAQRRQLHRAMAELLESSEFSSPPYAEIAYHWKAADEFPRAVQYLEKAGEQARSQGDFEAATRYFNESLGLN